jgi:hypothetical protein
MDLDSFTVNFGVKYRTAIQMTHQIGKVSFKTLVFFLLESLKRADAVHFWTRYIEWTFA